jgi:hypothetical protein
VPRSGSPELTVSSTDSPHGTRRVFNERVSVTARSWRTVPAHGASTGTLAFGRRSRACNIPVYSIGKIITTHAGYPLKTQIQ